MKKTTFPWILAIIITLAAIYYQRATGPTYPRKINAVINNKSFNLKLPASFERQSVPEVVLDIPSQNNEIKASLIYKLLGSADAWDTIAFNRVKRKTNSPIKNIIYKKYDEDVLIAVLPILPTAGKYEYYVKLTEGNTSNEIAKHDPVIARFKNSVPANVLLPHVLLMFIAMLLSNLAGLLAIFGNYRTRKYTILTFLAFLVGGMIYGPIVQNYAFGEYWTGIPFGWDLTDNKTLIAFVFWLMALLLNIRKERFGYIIVAAIVTLAVYLIPHSLYGSTLDPQSGKIVQGVILGLF